MAAAGAAKKKSADVRSNDTDTSMSVLDKIMSVLGASMPAGRNIEKRARSEALEIALAVDL